MPHTFISDDDPRRQERADLGEGVSLSFYSNKLHPTQQSESLSTFSALEMHQRDHFDMAVQQNRTARIIRVVMLVGFLMITANVVVITETTNLMTRIVLGGASALALSLVYFFRSTIMPVNRELLAQRKDIRASASQIEERERDIAMLRPLLNSNPDGFQAVWKQLHK